MSRDDCVSPRTEPHSSSPQSSSSSPAAGPRRWPRPAALLGMLAVLPSLTGAAVAAPSTASSLAGQDAEPVRRRLDAGSGLLARGEAALAVPEYRAALDAADPASSEAVIARYGLGLALTRLGRPREVAEVLAAAERWREGTPYHAAALLLLGDARRASGDASGAASALASAEAVATRRSASPEDRALLAPILSGLAEAAWSAGDWAAVEGAADRLLAATGGSAGDRDPDGLGARRVRAAFLAAAAAARRGDDAATVRRADMVLEAGGAGEATRRSARLLRGGALERLGRTDEAAGAYAALEPRTRDAADAVAAEAMIRLAGIDLDRGRPEAARRVLLAVADVPLAADRDRERTRLLARAFLATGDPASATAAIEAGLTRHGDADGRLAWLAGRAALAAGDPGAAADAFARSLDSAPDGPVAAAAAFDRIVALRNLQRWDAAGDAAEAGLMHAGTPAGADLRPRIRHLLAASRLDGDRPAEAVAACEQFRAEHPEHPLSADVHQLEATARQRTGDLDGAAAAWARAAETAVDDAAVRDARARRGLVLMQLGREDEAAADLRDARARGHDDASIHLALGDLAVRRGDWDEASDRLADAAARLQAAGDPASDEARRTTTLRLAHVARRAGRLPVAIDAADAVLAAAPSPAEAARAHLERGLALEATGRSEDAQAAFVAAVRAGGLDVDAAPDSRAVRSMAASRRDVAGDDRPAIIATALGRLGAMADAADEPGVAARRYALLAALTGDDRTREAGDVRLAISLDAGTDSLAAAEAWERVADRTNDAERRADALARAALARARRSGAEPGADPDEDEHRRVLASVERALAEPAPPPTLRPALGLEQVRRLRALDRPEAAIEAGGRLIAAHPQAPETDRVRLEMAEVLSADGRHAEADFTLAPLLARDPAGRAAPIDPSVVRAAAWRAGLARRAGDRPGPAAEAFERVLELAGDDDGLRRAALVLAGEMQLAAGRPAEAAPHFERLVRDDADPAARDAALLRLAECRVAQRRWAVAEQHYDTYLQRHPGDERWYVARFGRGRARESQGRMVAAMDDYRAVAERHDGATAARAQFQLGECLYAMGRHEDALRELLKVEILFDAPAWTAAALHEAAGCLEQLGRADEARAMLERLVQEHPGSDWAGRAQRRLAASSAAPNR